MIATRRLLRHVTLGASCAVAAGALAACGSPSDATKPTVTQSPTPAATKVTSAMPPNAVASTNPLGVPDTAFNTKKPITGAAVRRWGQASVQRAYREAVEFAFREGWNPTLMNTSHDHVTPAQYSDVTRYMTASCAASFNKDLAGFKAEDAKASTALESISYTELTGPNNSKLTTGPDAITGKTFTSANASVDNSSAIVRLALSFEASAIVRTRDAQGKVYVIPTHRKMTFWLVRNSGGDATGVPWLIDGINSHQWSDKPR